MSPVFDFYMYFGSFSNCNRCCNLWAAISQLHPLSCTLSVAVSQLQPPSCNTQLQFISCSLFTATSQLQVLRRNLQFPTCQLQVVSCSLSVATSQLQFLSCNLSVASSQLAFLSCNLPAATSQLQFWASEAARPFFKSDHFAGPILGTEGCKKQNRFWIWPGVSSNLAMFVCVPKCLLSFQVPRKAPLESRKC